MNVRSIKQLDLIKFVNCEHFNYLETIICGLCFTNTRTYTYKVCVFVCVCVELCDSETMIENISRKLH